MCYGEGEGWNKDKMSFYWDLGMFNQRYCIYDLFFPLLFSFSLLFGARGSQRERKRKEEKVGIFKKSG